MQIVKRDEKCGAHSSNGSSCIVMIFIDFSFGPHGESDAADKIGRPEENLSKR